MKFVNEVLNSLIWAFGIGLRLGFLGLVLYFLPQDLDGTGRCEKTLADASLSDLFSVALVSGGVLVLFFSAVHSGFHTGRGEK